MKTFKVNLEPIEVVMEEEDMEGLTEEQIHKLAIEWAMDYDMTVIPTSVEEIPNRPDSSLDQTFFQE